MISIEIVVVNRGTYIFGQSHEVCNTFPCQLLMDNFGQNWIARIHPVPNDLVLDFVATTTPKVYEVTVALHRVDWDT